MKFQLFQPLSFILLGQRSNQEDCRWPDCDEIDAKQHFFIVCDGVGGQEKGEVASNLVTKTIAHALEQFDWNNEFDNAAFASVLDEAYNALDRQATDANKGMATTFTLLVFHAGGVAMAHIGDSRIYHIRAHEGIIYRSNDHSLVNSLVHRGVLTPEQASVDPRRNIITRYMAPTDADQTRSMANLLNTKDVKQGDYFFLCSDGVLQSLDDDTLMEIMEDDSDNAEKMRRIKNLCADSSDNSTAIMIQVKDVENDPRDNLAHIPDDPGQTMVVNENEEGVVNIASQNRKRHDENNKSLLERLKNIFH